MIVGLTGSIATGKSTLLAVAAAHLKWHAWSADAAVVGLYQFDQVFIELLASQFPNVYADGGIQKDKLIKVVLSTPGAMEKLESILHPYLKKKLENLLKNMEGENIILEVPLLFEVGWEHLCDQTILLVCEENVQKQRLHKRNYSFDFQQFLLKRHWSDQKKMIKADYVIDTSGYVEDTLRTFVDKLQQIAEISSNNTN